MDKFNAMRTFIHIAEQGSLTAAARVLDTSLPSVVRTLAALEQQIGVRLLNRTTRRIALTEAGRSYLTHCRDILTALENAEAELGATAALPTGTVVVTAPVLFGQMFVAPSLMRYLQQHPGVRGRLVLLDRFVDLIEEGIDVGVRIGALHDSSLVAQTIGTVRHVVVASPAHLKQHGIPSHPSDLAGANCILRSSMDASSWEFHSGRKRIEVQLSSNLECNQAAPAIDACIAGLQPLLVVPDCATCGGTQAANCARCVRTARQADQYRLPVA